MACILFHLDTNSVNARQANAELNELENLAALGCIDIDFSETAYGEASHGNGKRAHKAEEFTWSGLSGQAEFEEYRRNEIASIVFPYGCLADRQKKDVEVILTASMCDAILITTDGASKSQPRGILGSKADLAAIGIRVMTPSEALDLANNHSHSHGETRT